MWRRNDTASITDRAERPLAIFEDQLLSENLVGRQRCQIKSTPTGIFGVLTPSCIRSPLSATISDSSASLLTDAVYSSFIPR